MKYVLVTGSKGFIAHHIIKRLMNDEVENIYCYPHGIINPDWILYEREFYEIYNFAGTPSPSKYMNNKLRTLRTNTIGLNNLLMLAHNNNARFFQASTVSVYGNTELKMMELFNYGNVNQISSKSCYEEGKRCAEAFCINYYMEQNVEVRIGRLGDTYGPNMSLDHGGVITTFIKQALQNKDITIFGDGGATRTYCYIDDTVEGIMRLMNSGYFLPVNIASDKQITIKDLAEFIIELCGSKSQIVYKYNYSDVIKRDVSIEKAKEVIQWKPLIELKDGLIKTIDDIRNRL